MRRFKAFISTFFAFLLSAGLVISAFHVHELADLHDHYGDRFLIEEIHLCPICEAVFEYHFDADVDTRQLHVSPEENILFEPQLFSTPIFTDKDGRSPPFTG